MQPIEFSPKVDLGTILSIVTAVSALVFGLGKLVAKLDEVKTAIHELRSDFDEHVREDKQSFHEIWAELRRATK